MRLIYIAGATLLAVGCSQAADTEGSDMTADMSQSGDENSEARPINGRWGIQYEACSDDNVSGDGLIQISEDEVIIGFEACSIAGIARSGDVFEIEGQCQGMEGPYERTLYFSSPQEGVLRWDNREMSRVEDYVACEGGAVH